MNKPYKQCKQCGENMPIEAFRNYYGGRKGTYKLCKACERINSRVKYLEKKSRTVAEDEELSKIHALYEAQRLCGLAPPQRRSTLRVNLDTLIDKYNVAEPPELTKWRTCDLTLEPDYYIDTVYEDLLRVYKPVVGFNISDNTPIYDTSYVDVLEAILTRFYTYEEEYYGHKSM